MIRYHRVVVRQRPVLALLALLCVVVFSAGEARADRAERKARKIFSKATRHYDLGEYEQALRMYKQAYRVKALPAFLFNIAQCHRKLDQPEEAIKLYQSYLTQVPDSKNRKLVVGLIQGQRKILAERDKKRRLADAEKARAEAKKTEAEQTRMDAKKRQAEAAASRAAAAEARVERQRELDSLYDRHPIRPWAIGTAGVGVATIGAGVFFGVRSKETGTEFSDLGCGDPGVPLGQDQADVCDSTQAKGERQALVSNVLSASGAAIIAGAVILWLIDPGNVERPAESSVTVGITPSSAVVSWTW